MISVQEADFDVAEEYQSLLQPGEAGAVVCFVGTVRDFSPNTHEAFYLEHYPEMTQAVLHKIVQQASERWSVAKCRVIHRVGQLLVADQIVFVGASSKHRKDAFAACEFIIDLLKTEAPFWKKEGERWVDANDADQHRADRWLNE